MEGVGRIIGPALQVVARDDGDEATHRRPHHGPVAGLVVRPVVEPDVRPEKFPPSALAVRPAEEGSGGLQEGGPRRAGGRLVAPAGGGGEGERAAAERGERRRPVGGGGGVDLGEVPWFERVEVGDGEGEARGGRRSDLVRRRRREAE